MDATVFVKCVRATLVVSACTHIIRTVDSLIHSISAFVHAPLGGMAKREDHIAIASSLSPPQ